MLDVEEDCDPEEPSICCPLGKGVFLPFNRELEDTHPAGRAVIYFITLLWFFLGVAIISDVFMSAIEVITSAQGEKWVVVVGDGGEMVKVKKRYAVWNDTVANLTLMALGSSAPEILLAVIELFKSKFFAGKLGPSTIVGSAAFNFLIITAVCTTAIPPGDVRKIQYLAVYTVECFFSVCAYVWLCVILSATTPDVVSIPEGVCTFLMFWVLVLLAFLADKGYLLACMNPAEEPEMPGPVSRPRASLSINVVEGKPVLAREVDESLEVRSSSLFDSKVAPSQDAEKGVWMNGSKASTLLPVMPNRASTAGMSTMLRSSDGGDDHTRTMDLLAQARAKAEEDFPGLSEEMLAKVIEADLVQGQKKSRAHYRVKATRQMLGSKKVADGMGPLLEAQTMVEAIQAEEGECIIGFAKSEYSVMENAGQVMIQITRRGTVDSGTVRVRYCTKDETANGGDDYVPVDGFLDFVPGVKMMDFAVTIIDDVQWEEDERFSCLIEVVESHGVSAKLGNDTTMVTIVNDDDPGVLTFAQDELVVKETCGYVDVPVYRRNGASGEVGCHYKTMNDSALGGRDFVAIDDVELKFNDTETMKIIRVEIVDDSTYERREKFALVLSDCFGGATLTDTSGKPRQEKLQLDIVIESDDGVHDKVDHLAKLLNLNLDMYKLGAGSWEEQFKAAIWCNGSREEQQQASWGDMAAHTLCLPFKIVFSLVPPPEFCGGWPSFVCSIGAIGVVTAFIGDLAELLGCVLSIPDELTAITLVAFGTSLPDTFASKTAAVQDEYADASVGNVTGSNAVNVLLGLGLPWSIGSIYWAMNANNEALKATWMNTKVVINGVPTPYSEVFADLWPAYIYPAGDLSFSVAVYCGCALLCVILLTYRRWRYGGELGGPGASLVAIYLVLLWSTYIGLSAWRVL